MKKLEFGQLEHWKKQIVDEQLQWAKSVKNIQNTEILNAYEAGLNQGMQLLCATLKLHDFLSINYIKTGIVRR